MLVLLLFEIWQNINSVRKDKYFWLVICADNWWEGNAYLCLSMYIFQDNFILSNYMKYVKKSKYCNVGLMTLTLTDCGQDGKIKNIQDRLKAINFNFFCHFIGLFCIVGLMPISSFFWIIFLRIDERNIKIRNTIIILALLEKIS